MPRTLACVSHGRVSNPPHSARLSHGNRRKGTRAVASSLNHFPIRNILLKLDSPCSKTHTHTNLRSEWNADGRTRTEEVTQRPRRRSHITRASDGSGECAGSVKTESG